MDNGEATVPLAAAVMTAMEVFTSSMKGLNSSLRSRLFTRSSYLEAPQKTSHGQGDKNAMNCDVKMWRLTSISVFISLFKLCS